MFDSALGIIAPHLCLDCGKEGSVWCAGCRLTAPTAIERCYKCNRLSVGGRTCKRCRRGSRLYSVRAATRYEATAKAVIWKLKFNGARNAVTVVADIIAARLPMPNDAVITYAPTANRRVRQRGYDQAKLIAQRLAKHSDLPFSPLLLRLGTVQQHGATRMQRMSQLRDAYQPRHLDIIKGTHIILVDDVITTGATLEAAAAVLKAAGAKRIEAIVFAQA